MFFAGNFAQLPPVGGHSLFSGNIGTQLHSTLTVAGQEAAIGKALWHQITTVVILKQNMRQKTQSPENAALRTALINMLYFPLAHRLQSDFSELQWTSVDFSEVNH